jgi:phosphatidylglycerol lysyltransferase
VSPEDDAARRIALRDAVMQFGSDPISFLGLESGMRSWFDEPNGTGACIAYFDTGSAWIAAGGPLVRADAKARAADRFVAAARAQGRRASFFAADFAGDGWARVLLGERPIFRPELWLRASKLQPSFRAQLRRARSKGISVRRLDPAELAEGSPLRLDVDRLAREWLASRHIEPMAFLVALEPYHEPRQHRYFVAERDGRPVEFLSAVPFREGRGWLVEDALRSRAAPNGTTELLLEALMNDIADADVVTLGLTPLSGPIAWPLRAASWLTRPLFDFAGLRRFRERMRPQAWERVFLVFPRGDLALFHIVDTLRAFAGGALLPFAARSIARRPSGSPWVLAVLLVPWTLAVGCMAAAGATAYLDFSRAALALVTAFYAGMAGVLFRVATRPTVRRLVACSMLAACNAALSAIHLGAVGAGDSSASAILRTFATAAPAGAAVVLGLTAARCARVPSS